MGSPLPRAIWDLVREAGQKFIEHRAPRLGAALAFYTTLSLAPLLLVVMALVGAIFGQQAAQGEVAHQMKDLIGDEGARAVEAMLASTQTSGGGTLSMVVGLATLLFAATGVFVELQDALNTIWGVERKSTGIWSLVRDRLLSFSLVCGLAFLLLVSLVISAGLSAVGTVVTGWVGTAFWMQAVNQIVSLALIVVLFAMIFNILPDVKIAWSDVWLGAFITGVLFTLGKYLIGLYLGRAALGSAYGAAGSFVVLLTWVYYSTQILLFGAELTRAYSARHGTGAGAPAPGAQAQASPPELDKRIAV
jgi:membrane protein